MMMNKLILILTVVLFGISARAQNLKESDVPSQVKSKFNAMNPNVNNVRWERNDGRFEAEFDEDSLETSVYFNGDGTYIKTEKEISISLLPSKARDFVLTNHPGKNIREAEIVTNASGSISYEAEIDNIDYYFDSDGNLLRKRSDDRNRGRDGDDRDDDSDDDRGRDNDNRGRDNDDRGRDSDDD